MLAWLQRRGAELRLGVRITAAGLGAFALAGLLHLPQGYWAVFTALIVTQASVGGSLKASRDRIVGTLGGAVFGALVATLVPHADPSSFALVFALSLAPLAFLAAFRPRYRIAPVTASILLLSSASQMAPLEAAAYRILEIGVGCAVGVAVSLLVLPARANRLGLNAAAGALDLLARLMEAHRAALLGEAPTPNLAALNADIRKAMARLEDLGQEASHERASHLAEQRDFGPVVRTMRRVRNDLVMVGRTAAAPLPDALRPPLGAALAAVMDAAAAAMRDAGKALAARAPPPALDALAVASGSFADAMAAMRRAGLTHGLSDEATAEVFALGFALEQWRRDFEELHARAGEFALPGAAP